MPNPIPVFDHNLVLPPHLGDPVDHGQLSPYPCTTLDLCQRLGTTPERRAILGKFLDFRDRLRGEGLTNGFQWLDGSFLEDVETRQGHTMTTRAQREFLKVQLLETQRLKELVGDHPLMSVSFAEREQALKAKIAALPLGSKEARTILFFSGEPVQGSMGIF